MSVYAAFDSCNVWCRYRQPVSRATHAYVSIVTHASDSNKLQRLDVNDISITLVHREHPLIPPPHLEAEASGLLDRLLNIFYDANGYVPDALLGHFLTLVRDVLLVDATLNGLAGLVRARPSTANKIVSAVLNFNSTLR